MNREEESMIVLSRAIVVVIVIVITLISFSTGYFIGRYSRGTSVKEEKGDARAPEPPLRTSAETLPESPKESEKDALVVPGAGVTKPPVRDEKKIKERPVEKEKASTLEEGRFYLQVGAFREPSRALKLRARIRDNFNVIIIKEDGVSKVMVGGYSNKKEAMIAATRIKNLYRLDSIIINK